MSTAAESLLKPLDFCISGGIAMSLLQSILLGILQGATEFLPVSSSGHLALLQNLFHMDADVGVLFDAMLHLGTLIAVCIVFWKNFSNLVKAFVEMIRDLFTNISIFFTSRGQADKHYIDLVDTAYKKFVVLIIITSIPTAVIALIVYPVVKMAQSNLLIPGVCLVITAIILLISDSARPGKKKVRRTTYKDAAIVGVAQGIAVLPGISRSGSTITACLMLGFDRTFAVKYSFLASLPAIIGANLFELRHIGSDVITGAVVGNCFVGMIVAGIVGYISIKAMLYFVQSKKFSYFAYYCAIIGIIAIIAYFIAG